jgi:hypothetical protein
VRSSPSYWHAFGNFLQLSLLFTMAARALP